ncbi:MAG: cell envelope biogenesis protein OmpA [Rhodospirillales bacterium]|nr:cell envelope biogenesis protein OmpA [Rhodospirillales bacterium]
MLQMRLLKPVAAGLGVALMLGGCTNPYSPQQRALGGAALGAGTGAAIGAIAGGGRGAATGALIGGALGAVGGAVTTPHPPLPQPYYPPPPQQPSYAPPQPYYPPPPPNYSPLAP